MKRIYRLFVRGKYFYAEDTRTGHQESLKTTDRVEAERLLSARNEAANNTELTLALGRAYLAQVDPGMLTRTWAEAMAVLENRGAEPTREPPARSQLLLKTFITLF